MKLPKITKKGWMQIHTYLSLFFLPACLVYIISGVGYTFGYNVNAGGQIYDLNISEIPSKENAQEFILQTLKDNKLEAPSSTNVSIHRGKYIMGDIMHFVIIAKDKDNKPIMRVIDRGIYGFIALMHLSKGSFWFDIIAIGFCASLVLFYLSGLIVTSFCKRNRKSAFITLGVGFVITLVAMILSIKAF